MASLSDLPCTASSTITDAITYAGPDGRPRVEGKQIGRTHVRKQRLAAPVPNREHAARRPTRHPTVRADPQTTLLPRIATRSRLRSPPSRARRIDALPPAAARDCWRESSVQRLFGEAQSDMGLACQALSCAETPSESCGQSKPAVRRRAHRRGAPGGGDGRAAGPEHSSAAPPSGTAPTPGAGRVRSSHHIVAVLTQSRSVGE